MKNYQQLLEQVMRYGEKESQRAVVKGESVTTRVLYSQRLEFDLSVGFPMVTCKKTSMKIVREELKWFLRGENNVKSLQEVGVGIWDEWADGDGELGGSYPGCWRRFGAQVLKTGEDQVAGLEKIMRLVAKEGLDDPIIRRNKRRMILTGWDPNIKDNRGPVGCHTLAQFHISPKGELHCDMYMRSVDLFLGLPINIASYGLLTTLLAMIGGLTPRRLVLTLGNAHVYANHEEQVWQLLDRKVFTPPTLQVSFEGRRDDWSILEGGWDACLKGYVSGESLSGDIAV